MIPGSSFNNSITFLYRFGSSKKKAVLVLMAFILIASSKIVIGVSFRYSGGISFLAPRLNKRKNRFNGAGGFRGPARLALRSIAGRLRDPSASLCPSATCPPSAALQALAGGSASPQAIAGRAWQEGGRCEALRAGDTVFWSFLVALKFRRLNC